MAIDEALSYPFNEDRWIETMAIGTILKKLSFLVVPWILLQGYYTAVMRATMAGRDHPPEFEEWGRLFVDGLKASTVHAVYFLVPFVAFAVLVVPSLLAMVRGELAAGFSGMIFGLAVSLVLFAISLYVAMAGHVAFAHTGRLRDAFGLEMVRLAASREYLVAFVMAKLVLTGVGSVKAVVAGIPGVHFVLILLVPFLVKYALTVNSRLYAEAGASVLSRTTTGR